MARGAGLLVLVVGAAGVVTLVALGLRGGGAGSLDRAAVSAPAERVRVEVLNAGGVSGAARDATLRLRDVGFDVVQFGNARAFDEDSSMVIDRVGRPDLAEAVANALGIGNVLTEPDPNLFVDVTVLVGRTWTGPIGARASREAPQRALWDPRGWLGR